MKIKMKMKMNMKFENNEDWRQKNQIWVKMKIRMHAVTSNLNMKIGRILIATCLLSSFHFHVTGFYSNCMALHTACVTQVSYQCALMSTVPTTPIRVVDKNHLPLWLSNRDRIPPCWLLSKELPIWFHHDGPPKWMYQKSIKPPTWMLGDMIPEVIKKSYAVDRPPMWMLNMDKLPRWFSEFDILPDWLIAFGEARPPEWMLKDDNPQGLKKV